MRRWIRSWPEPVRRRISRTLCVVLTLAFLVPYLVQGLWRGLRDWWVDAIEAWEWPT